MGRLIRYGPRRAQVIDVRPGEGHFEHIDPGSGAWRRVVDWLDERR